MQVKVLDGKIENDYKWNPGPAVGRFLTQIREKELVAVRCTKTSKVFLPPQSFSPYGNIKMDRYLTITTDPVFKAGTIVYRAPWNIPEGVTVPYMLAGIGFAGADSDLIHIIVTEEAKLKALKPGDKLRAVWKEERTGTIRDILYFEPATTA